MANLLNSKLKFLQGDQASLDKLLTGTSTINKDNIGSFYLTNDTHRLYIQESDTSIVPVNEGVVTVPALSNLPVVSTDDEKKAYAGRFYYVTASNILCVYSGQGWVQINANTNTTLESATDAITVEKLDNNSTKITTKVADQDGNEATGCFNLKDSTNRNKVVVDYKYNEIILSENTYQQNKYYIYNNSQYQLATEKFSASETYYAREGIIDIQGEKYSLTNQISIESNQTTLTLSGINDTSEGASSEINIYGGSNITLTKEDDGFKINSSYTDTTLDDTDNLAVTLEYDGFSDDYIEVKLNQAKYAANTYYIKSSETYILDSSENFSSTKTYYKKSSGNGDLSIELLDTAGNIYTAKVQLGKYYTEEEIDAKFRGLDGLTYKGTIDGLTKPVPTVSDNIESGYMYKISSQNVEITENITAHLGDIIIATGTEDKETGYLQNVEWTLIPSGDDTDTTYRISNETYGFGLHNNVNNGTDGTFKLVAGNVITLKDAVQTDSATNVVDKTVTITHSTVEHTNNFKGDNDEDISATLQDQTSLSYINNITVNEQGHVTNISKRTANLRDTTYTLSGATTAHTDNTITITSTLTDNTNDTSTSQFSLTSDTLQLSEEEGVVTAELVWGTF